METLHMETPPAESCHDNYTKPQAKRIVNRQKGLMANLRRQGPRQHERKPEVTRSEPLPRGNGLSGLDKEKPL